MLPRIITSLKNKHTNNTLYESSYIRYLVACYNMQTIRYIIIGQDPYKQDIYPYLAAAFSYDQRITATTPSVNMLVESLIFTDDTRDKYRDKMIHAFSQSYIFLKYGIIFINATYHSQLQDNNKVKEEIEIAALLRDIVITRDGWKDMSLSIISMGNTAQEVATLLSSSLTRDMNVTVYRTVHPAMLARMSAQDREARKYFNNINIDRHLFRIFMMYVGDMSINNNTDGQEIYRFIVISHITRLRIKAANLQLAILERHIIPADVICMNDIIVNMLLVYASCTVYIQQELV